MRTLAYLLFFASVLAGWNAVVQFISLSPQEGDYESAVWKSQVPGYTVSAETLVALRKEALEGRKLRHQESAKAVSIAAVVLGAGLWVARKSRVPAPQLTDPHIPDLRPLLEMRREHSPVQNLSMSPHRYEPRRQRCRAARERLHWTIARLFNRSEEVLPQELNHC